MIEFLFGLAAGSALSDGKKESDAEYRDRQLKADRRRASATLRKDLSDLPRIIDGQVQQIDRRADPSVWTTQFQVLRVGEWNLAIPADIEVVPGDSVRVVGNNKIKINAGPWHELGCLRVTHQKALLNMLTAIFKIGTGAASCWFLWKLLEQMFSNFLDAMVGNTFLFDENSAWYFIYFYSFGLLSAFLKSLPKGLPGVWSHTEKD